MIIEGPMVEGPRKSNPVNLEYEEKAKNLLKGGVETPWRDLWDACGKTGCDRCVTERNLNNKISRGGFQALFYCSALMRLVAGHCSCRTSFMERGPMRPSSAHSKPTPKRTGQKTR